MATPFTRGCELLALFLVLTVVAAIVWERAQIAARAIAALERAGYSNATLIGSDCRVAAATDIDGNRVTAYACAWGASDKN